MSSDYQAVSSSGLERQAQEENWLSGLKKKLQMGPSPSTPDLRDLSVYDSSNDSECGESLLTTEEKQAYLKTNAAPENKQYVYPDLREVHINDKEQPLFDASHQSSTHQRRILMNKKVALMEEKRDTNSLQSELSITSDLKRKTTKRTRKILRRTPGTWWEDIRQFRDGSVFHSFVVASVIGTTCGIIASTYYKVMYGLIYFFWDTLPRKYVIDVWPEWAYFLWMPLIAIPMAIGLGATVKYVGEPGDLPVTVKYNHKDGFLSTAYIIPMILASLCTIISSSSVGPEAPLGAICASTGGFISRKVFKQTDRNVIRKHSLMGIAGALSAFFGAPLGGSIFALEIHSRFGLEYFEHVIEATFCGVITLAVYRTITGLSIGPIFTITTPAIGPSDAIDIQMGFLLGLLGAAIAGFFTIMHKCVVGMFGKFNLLEDRNAIWRALLGMSVFLTIGEFIPYTRFFGQDQIEAIATLARPDKIPYGFPINGILDFKLDSALNCFLVGFFKLVCISFSLAGGFRGGFIFPYFAVGCAFGRMLVFFFPSLPPTYACLCLAGAINVAITRTALGTTVILVYLFGQQNAISAVITSCITSLFVTVYMPFIKSQVTRNDIDTSLYYEEEVEDEPEEEEKILMV